MYSFTDVCIVFNAAVYIEVYAFNLEFIVQNFDSFSSWAADTVQQRFENNWSSLEC